MLRETRTVVEAAEAAQPCNHRASHELLKADHAYDLIVSERETVSNQRHIHSVPIKMDSEGNL